MPRRSSIADDQARFRHMRDAAREAISFAAGRARGDLDRDRMLLHALVHCVQIIGEAAARISEEGRSKAPGVPWAKIVGMRHILVHAYFEIDLDAVWRAVQADLPVLANEVDRVLAGW